MGQTQLLREMPGDTEVGNACEGDKTNSSDVWQEIISQSASVCRRECLEVPASRCPQGICFHWIPYTLLKNKKVFKLLIVFPLPKGSLSVLHA